MDFGKVSPIQLAYPLLQLLFYISKLNILYHIVRAVLGKKTIFFRFSKKWQEKNGKTTKKGIVRTGKTRRQEPLQADRR
jgi:hypothetical protein